MDISAGLIAKGTAGALAASAAVGGGVMAGTNGWFDGLFRSNSVENEGVAQPTLETQDNGSHQETATNRGNGNEQGETGPKVNVSPSPGIEGSPVTSEANPSGVQGAQIGSEAGESLSGSDSTERGEHTASNLPQTPQRPVASGDGVQKSKLTKWDKALINYLKEEEKTDWDIEFDIKTGNNEKTELSNNFPNFEDGGNNTQKKKITITVTATTKSSLKGTNSTNKIAELKKMNGGDTSSKDWTWECKIILSRNKKNDDEISLVNKEKLIGDDGYFNRLMKKVSGENDETNKKNLKGLKAKFIENCGMSREKSEETLTGEKTSVKKIFELEKVGSDETKWKVKEDDFNAWFSTTSAQQV